MRSSEGGGQAAGLPLPHRHRHPHPLAVLVHLPRSGGHRVLVEEAQESKAPTERFIDRFSRFYTPGVVAVAALVAIAPPLWFGGDWSGWIY